jgi:23S rRNA pseudouridine955/2504/2580 synthase/23S rRNA pseudouridine1911/1915/1917 synthase
LKKDIDILYQDEDLVIVSKPSGVLTIPDRFDATKTNLYHQLQAKFGEIFVVHRIDRETSGIVCFARNAEAHRNLSQQFEARLAEKFYLALLEGKMHAEEGIIDKPIAESMTEPGKMVIAKRGKPSVTHWKVLEEFSHYTLVEAEIKTGRMHQIRIHFQSDGYPLAIDSVYGKKAAFLLSDVKLKKFKQGKFSEEERPLMSRTTLHAYRLMLTHPTSGERMNFICEPPKDFQAVLNQLRKWGNK